MTPLEVLRRYPAHDYTLYGALASRAQGIAQHSFIEFENARLSYAESRARVHQAMALLAAYGVKPGDRVAVMSHNHPASVILLIALASLGAVMVGVNPDFGEKEAHYVLEHSQSSGIVCSPAALATVQAVADALPARPWIRTNEPDFLAGPARDAPAVVGRADDACILIYSSGTTGFPKGVMHSQRTVVLAGEGFVRRMHLDPAERILCIMPMFHVNAIFYSLSGAIAAGATLLLEEKFSASKFWHSVAARRATETNTIAAVMNILMRRPREEYVPDHTLRKIYGAPFSPEIYRVFAEEFNVPHLIEGYGMSEIPGVFSNPFDGERRQGSMGKPSLHPDPAVNLAEVRIVDEAGNEVPTGVTGEIAVRTPTIMKGYYRDPAATAAAFRDDFFLTGDLARVDADGYYWFVARKKDIIRRRGENISGAEIDRVAGDHPEVVEAAAIGVPAELGEDEVLLAVVRKPGSRLTEQELAAWCGARLAPFKVPRFVLFVDALPRTPTHRIAKFELRKDATLKQRAVDLNERIPVSRKRQPINSDLGWSTADRITVRGLDLPNEIMGHLNLGDMAFLELTGRRPKPEESKLFNAIAVTLVEHGITPSALATRMTIIGAPEAMQAAVAAGLCGLGSVFVGSMEHVAVMLEAALPYGKDPAGVDLEKLASGIVDRHRAEKRIVPGIGHPIHKPVDPRVPRLFAIARETGFHGRYVELMQAIQARAEAASGRVLPMNATGAIGALSCELGFPPRIVRGFGVLARAIGLVGHIMEEWEQPMALELWHRADEEASEGARKKSR